jgi:ATP-dependent Clp protease adaptor protein ClpS
MEDKNKTLTRNKPGKKDSTGSEDIRYLVLHNDDHHTFDFVIKCLVEICGHSSLQAEQCTYLVHFKGSCDILTGTHKQLVPYHKAMSKKKLIVTIE